MFNLHTYWSATDSEHPKCKQHSQQNCQTQMRDERVNQKTHHNLPWNIWFEPWSFGFFVLVGRCQQTHNNKQPLTINLWPNGPALEWQCANKRELVTASDVMAFTAAQQFYSVICHLQPTIHNLQSTTRKEHNNTTLQSFYLWAYEQYGMCSSWFWKNVQTWNRLAAGHWSHRIPASSRLESLMTHDMKLWASFQSLLWIQSSLKPSSPEVTSVTVSRTILLALSGSLERLLNARIKQISAKADLACSNWSPFVRMHSASLVISVAADVLAFWPSLKFRRAWDSDTTSETAFTVFTSSQFQKKTPIVSRFQKISNRWRLQYINIGVIVCTVNEKGPKNSLSLSGCCLCPFTRSTQ